MKYKAVKFIMDNDLSKLYKNQIGSEYKGDVDCEFVTDLQGNSFISFSESWVKDFVKSSHLHICTFRKSNINNLSDFILKQMLKYV